MHDRIIDWADHVAVAHATQEECDELGMSAAQKLAAQRALAQLGVEVDHVLVDGNWDFVETHPTTKIVKGDAISISIAILISLALVTTLMGLILAIPVTATIRASLREFVFD